MRTENCSKNFSQKTASQVLAVNPPSLNWEFRTDFLPRQNNTWVPAFHHAELLQKMVAEWTGRILNNRFTLFLSISIQTFVLSLSGLTVPRLCTTTFSFSSIQMETMNSLPPWNSSFDFYLAILALLHRSYSTESFVCLQFPPELSLYILYIYVCRSKSY